MKYHQQCSENSDYLSGLKLLEYDMLYGDQESYQYEERVWEPTELEYGFSENTIESVKQLGLLLHIHGTGFNEYSVIYINGKKYDTNYNTETFVTSLLEEPLQSGDEIVISQVNSEGTVLKSTNTWIVE
jgi:hypothetical protein